MNEEYNSDGSLKDDGPNDPREMCLVEFGSMVIGCARANMHEKQRKQQDSYADSDNLDNLDYAKKVDKSKLVWSEWHAFFGWKTQTKKIPKKNQINKHINMLLFAPKVNRDRTDPDNFFLYKGTDWSKTDQPINQKKYEWCTCPSGEIALVSDSNLANADKDCNAESQDNLCEGGFSTCIDYGSSGTKIELISKTATPFKVFRKVKCQQHAYNYNRKSIKMHMRYGFGVIVPHVCGIGRLTGKLCNKKNELNFSGKRKHVLEYILTDSQRAYDINNMARIVHNFEDNSLNVKDKVEVVDGTGKWGGVCKCPSGKKFPVGGRDKGDASGCKNGVMEFSATPDQERARSVVTCVRVAQTKFHNSLKVTISRHHIRRKKAHKKWQKAEVMNNKKDWRDKNRVYKSKRSDHNKKIKLYKKSIQIMRAAKSVGEYNKGYKIWTGVKSYFTKNGCSGPVPPAPVVTHVKPRIENECGMAYKLGWKIGQNLAMLVYHAGDGYVDVLKQMKCVKEYVAAETSTKTTGTGKLKELCLDRGRKESSRLIWGLSKRPKLLKKYLKQTEKFAHWKIAYEMGYDRYVKDLMDTSKKNDRISIYRKNLIQPQNKNQFVPVRGTYSKKFYAQCSCGKETYLVAGTRIMSVPESPKCEPITCENGVKSDRCVEVGKSKKVKARGMICAGPSI